MLEILLVTSRDTGRWVIPKGWPIKGLKPSKSAAREAFEEAGVQGEVASEAIGSFEYEKLVDALGTSVPCEVQVFPLLVSRQFKKWPEVNERESQWFAPAKASEAVNESELKRLIKSFAASKAPKAKRVAALGEGSGLVAQAAALRRVKKHK